MRFSKTIANIQFLSLCPLKFKKMQFLIIILLLQLNTKYSLHNLSILNLGRSIVRH